MPIYQEVPLIGMKGADHRLRNFVSRDRPICQRHADLGKLARRSQEGDEVEEKQQYMLD